MKVKRIKWRDSNIYVSQTEQDTDFQVAIIETVGFLISEDKDKIVLAGDIIDDECRRVIVIPKENIIT